MEDIKVEEIVDNNTNNLENDNNNDNNNGDNNSNDESKSPKKEKKHLIGNPILREIVSYVFVFALAIFIAYIINTYILSNNVVPSASMEDTIMTGTRLFGNRLAYNSKDPERGDIVVFEYPVSKALHEKGLMSDKEYDDNKYFIKRIIGLPGETIEIKDGCVYIDGEKLDESDYYDGVMEGSFGPYEIPEDNYFMMGDNRNSSSDSRMWNDKAVEAGLSIEEHDYTTVPSDDIVSKAFIQYYPKIKLID